MSQAISYSAVKIHNVILRLARTIPAVIALASAIAEGRDGISFSKVQKVPAPAEMSVLVETDGRTSVLKHADITKITGDEIPATFADTLVGNTEGFSWYVSRHFAIKSNLADEEAVESAALLETAWPQYEAIFGRTPPGMEYRRLPVVLASDRNSLQIAMADDDMHILNLGGITQEGFACSYLYAGFSYQTRYILLHEATHLFQYCISGNTRNCYGFFVEGIADFFSSHVYDKKKRSLTVNVLDRAPIHNHLAAGIEEWQREGRPSFSDLYRNHRGSRGLDVILTAFLQSTPEYERNWLAYCHGTVLNNDATKAGEVSDKLIGTLYGGAERLDAPFAEWMERLAPSFLTGIREFDQDGDSFISVYVPSEATPATLTLANPLLAVSDFVLDWPHSSTRTGKDPFFQVDMTLPSAVNGKVFAGIRFYSRDMRSIRETAITNSASSKLSKRLVFTEEELASGGAPAGTCIAELFASAPGVEFTPLAFSTQEGAAAPVPKAPACRFTSSRFLSRLLSAAEILGNKAPQQLLIAVEALKKPSASSFIQPEDFESAGFWKSLAAAITKSSATEEKKREALRTMSGAELVISRIGGQVLAELQGAFPALEKREAVLQYAGGKKNPKQGGAEETFRFDDPHGPFRITMKGVWAGQPIDFEARYESGRVITDWWILGPFRMSGGKYANETFPPDTYPMELDKVFTADDGTRLRWKKVQARGGGQHTPPLLHFAKEFGRQANNSAAYAYTEIVSEKEEKCELQLGVSDGITVWNNSTMIFRDTEKREWADGNIRVEVLLKKGVNRLLFKLLHSNGVWFLSGRVAPLGK